MSTRLPSDGALLGYWGFDEANVADPAVDESGNGNPLTVFNAAGVLPARIGNGRQFDGAATYAAPADSSIFQIGIQSVIAWFILDSVNQIGDGLRPVVTLEGPGVGPNDATDIGLHVSNAGALVLHLTASGNVPVVLATAPGLIRVNRYYSLAVTIGMAPSPPDGNNGIVASLWLNNVATPWASLTVGGVGQPDPNAEGPVRAPCGGNVTLTVGGRQKSTSKWHGVLDELSVHSAVRAFDPYLKAAYFRLTLAATFSRLTMHDTVKVLAAADMGGGTRWWCYERDQSIYVIRENSLGLFSAEVQLTEGPMLANGALSPGGVGIPRLAYDAASDTLVVAFVGAGRIFKVTALSSDAPAKLVMPTTGETVGGGIKVVDPVDPFRSSAGGGLPLVLPTTGTAATIRFLHVPSFGIAVSGASAQGYVVVRRAGGGVVVVGYATGAKQVARPEARGNYWFVPLTERVDGATYVALPLDGVQALAGLESNAIVDHLGVILVNADLPALLTPDVLVWTRHGDATHEHLRGSGGEAPNGIERVGFATVFPLKVRVPTDGVAMSVGETGIRHDYGFTSVIPVKQSVRDAGALSCGGSTSLTMELGTRRISL